MTKPRFSRSAFRRALSIVIIASLCLTANYGRAQPPAPVDRFRSVEGLDELQSLPHARQLSRPMGSLRQADIPLPDPSFAVGFTHYPTSQEIVTFVHQLESAYPQLVQVTEVGRSWQGRPLVSVRIGNEATGDPDSRPALYVEGGLHAREVVSSQAALYFLWSLVSQYGIDPLVSHLLDTRTVYAVPCVNPDGNDIFLTSDQRQRKTANPTASDDDGDGLFDEDGREGAGYGTYDTYHFTFDPDWASAHPEDPFVQDWRTHLLSQEFVVILDRDGLELQQFDDDGDGQAGEDPPGGVDPNRNYDIHWEMGEDNPSSSVYRGPQAFSEPETRAVRDLVLGHPNILTASSFQSGNDLLLHPWAWSAEAELLDAFWYETLSRKGSQLTEVNGFQGAPHTWTARGLHVASGSEMDWLYGLGILAWTPEVYGASELAFVQRITTTNRFTVGISVGEAFNPRPEEIARTVDRWLRWHLYLLSATPNVGLSRVETSTSALTAVIANDGLLPLDVEVVAETEGAAYSTTIRSLSAAEHTWELPLQAQPRTYTVTITLTGTSTAGMSQHRLQTEVMTLQVDDGDIRVVEGALEPFVDLASFFGSWFAGREWDTPEYHLGPPLLFEQFLPVLVSGAR